MKKIILILLLIIPLAIVNGQWFSVSSPLIETTVWKGKPPTEITLDTIDANLNNNFFIRTSQSNLNLKVINLSDGQVINIIAYSTTTTSISFSVIGDYTLIYQNGLAPIGIMNRTYSIYSLIRIGTYIFITELINFQ